MHLEFPLIPFHFLQSSSSLTWFPRPSLGYSQPTIAISSLPLFHMYFCLFILFMGFSRQEYRNGLPFPSSVDHDLSELSNMTLPWGLILAPQPLYPGKYLYNRTTDTSQEDVWLLNENMALSISPAHLAGAVNQLLDCMTSVSTGFPSCFDGIYVNSTKRTMPYAFELIASILVLSFPLTHFSNSQTP